MRRHTPSRAAPTRASAVQVECEMERKIGPMDCTARYSHYDRSSSRRVGPVLPWMRSEFYLSVIRSMNLNRKELRNDTKRIEALREYLDVVHRVN